MSPGWGDTRGNKGPRASLASRGLINTPVDAKLELQHNLEPLPGVIGNWAPDWRSRQGNDEKFFHRLSFLCFIVLHYGDNMVILG
jgi:hypothetical protein